MERERAWVLVVIGGLVTLGAAWLAPRPMEMGSWEPSSEEPPRALSARGPAIARYDAANDTTVALLLCGHWYCSDHALLIEGDARDALARPRIVLAASARTSGLSPLEPPLEVGEPFAAARSVTVATFVARPFWPAFLAMPVGALLVAAGATWLRTRRGTAGQEAAGGTAGAGWGAFMATFPGDTIVFAFLLVAVTCAIALVTMTVPRWKKARWVVGAFALATVLMFVYARPWFPSMPSL